MHIGAAVGLKMSVPDTARFWADRLAGGARFANALSERAAETRHAKLQANTIAREAADLGARVGGASGYTRGDIERVFRDAQAGWRMACSGEICKGTIGAGILSSTPQDGHHD